MDLCSEKKFPELEFNPSFNKEGIGDELVIRIELNKAHISNFVFVTMQVCM